MGSAGFLTSLRRRALPALATVCAAALVAADVATGPAARGATAPATVVTVDASPAARPLPAGYLGMSLEFPAVTAYAGRDPRAIDPVLVQLIRNLAPGQRPVLRIGGDSTDSSWWPLPGMRRPAGVRFSITRRWLAVTRALAAKLGARLILGVNLAAGSARLTAVEAHAVLATLGRSEIAALEIGNEPGWYGLLPWYRTAAGHPVFARPAGYGIGTFTHQLAALNTALPELPLAGPTAGALPGIAPLRTFLARAPDLGLVTIHRYGLNACVRNPLNPAYPTIAHLLSPYATTELASRVAPYVALAHATGLPLRLDELNSVACRGAAGVSDTYASALWALDTLFALDRARVDGVNIHTFPGAHYAPFEIRHAGGRWSAALRPLYAGLAMFAQAAPVGSRLLPVRAGPGVQAYATRQAATVRVTLINLSATTGRRVSIRLPVASGAAHAIWLRDAAGAGARTGVTLGGVVMPALTASGRLPAERPMPVPRTRGRYDIALPAMSAAVLTVQLSPLTGHRLSASARASVTGARQAKCSHTYAAAAPSVPALRPSSSGTPPASPAASTRCGRSRSRTALTIAPTSGPLPRIATSFTGAT
jgi:hypothetical protein